MCVNIVPTDALNTYKPTTNSVRKLIQKEFGQGERVRRDAAKGTSKANKKVMANVCSVYVLTGSPSFMQHTPLPPTTTLHPK